MIAKLKTALLASIAACAVVAVVPALSPANLFVSAAHASDDDNGSDDHGGGSESRGGSESHGSGHSSDDGSDHDANDDHGGRNGSSSDDSDDDSDDDNGKEHGKHGEKHGGRARGIVDLSSIDPAVLDSISTSGPLKVTLADGTVLRYEIEREHGKQVLKVKFPRTLTQMPTTVLVNDKAVNVTVKAPKTLLEWLASKSTTNS